MKTAIAIVVEHGAVTAIYSNAGDLEAFVLDHDNAADPAFHPTKENLVATVEYDPKLASKKRFQKQYAKVTCSICQEPCLARRAHCHQGEWIVDECCLDERLLSSE